MAGRLLSQDYKKNVIFLERIQINILNLPQKAVFLLSLASLWILHLTQRFNVLRLSDSLKQRLALIAFHTLIFDRYYNENICRISKPLKIKLHDLFIRTAFRPPCTLWHRLYYKQPIKSKSNFFRIHVTNTYGGSWRRTPLILNLDT